VDERILLGTTIADKLVHIDLAVLTDGRPGPPITPPDVPGRPDLLDLAPRHARDRVPFPGVHELDDPAVRGTALHFFANHELLAMELMALALLRFPDAPPAFRRGIAATIIEEQDHMRLYVERMNALGTRLGDIPVNRWFWDCIAPIDAPLDFVAGLSLTFEQANLDFAAWYGRAFRVVGDEPTALVLDRVLEDEIGHVRHGWLWFERWRDADLDAFEAWLRALPLPLTPARARGHVFCADARRRAGLPEAFITAVEVTGASRGRPPRVFWYNTACEAEIAHGRARTPTTAIRALAADLDGLQLLLAARDDVVLCRRPPSREHLQRLARLGLPLAQVVPLGADGAVELASIDHAHLGGLCPWGWTPVAQQVLAPLAPRLSPDLDPPHRHADPDALRRLYAKATGASLLRALLAEAPEPWWAPAEVVGVEVHDLSSALDHARALVGLGYPTAVVKSPWASSGRGALRLRQATLEAGQAGFIERVLREQGSVLVEPWLDRQVDLSFLLKVDAADDARLLATTRFFTDARGQYLGTLVGRATHALPRPILRWLTGEGLDTARLPRTAERIARSIGLWLGERGHRGFAGVDALIYRDPRGALRLKPLVEINPRTTMGHVAIALRPTLARGRVGVFAMLRCEDLPATTPTDELHLDAAGRIRAGVLWTTDPAAATQLRTALVVGADLAEVSARLDALGAPLTRAVLPTP